MAKFQSLFAITLSGDAQLPFQEYDSPEIARHASSGGASCNATGADMKKINGIHGTTAGDTLRGTTNVDFIYGYFGNDLLIGNSGHDKLVGGDGDDQLRGGAGRDRIVGGMGDDNLFGGAGSDRFVFASVPESGVTGHGDDIKDFSHREDDRIDLSAIDASEVKSGNQAFKFIGQEAFHGKAGELTVDFLLGNKWCCVRGDIDGDRLADFAVFVHGSAAADMRASDFVL